ncbi:hypothetical protein PCANB_002102 [Pneumocystis canis]|nr:hypothetical protein PCANB_002102 [Pneumocystis canis]
METNIEFPEDNPYYVNSDLNNSQPKKPKNQFQNISTQQYLNQNKNEDKLLLYQTELQNTNKKEIKNSKKTKNFKSTNSTPIKNISPEKSKQSINNKNKKPADTEKSCLTGNSNQKIYSNKEYMQLSLNLKNSSNNHVLTKSPKTPDRDINNTFYFQKSTSNKNNTWNFLDNFDNSPLRTPKSQRIIDSLERDKLKSPLNIETPKSKEISTKLFSPILAKEDFKPSKTPQNLHIYNDLIDTCSNIQNTYAKQRSFVAEPIDDIEHFFSYSSYNINSKNQLNNESNSEDSEPSSLNIKSIHELRESGINKKSLDEIQYLIDGLNKCNTLKLRQSCYIELAKKMNGIEFSRNFRSRNFSHQLLENSEKDTDIVILYCTLFILCLIFQDKKCAYALVSNNITFEIIFLGLSYNKDMIELCNFENCNINKSIQNSLIDLIKTEKSSNIHTNYTNKSSCCILSINAIKSIIFLPTWRTSNYLEKLASFGCISNFYDIIDKICKDNIKEQFCLIETIISSLEQYTLIINSNIHIGRISTIITLLTSNLFNNSEKKNKSHIFQSSLRLLINLTNNNPSICDEVTHPEFIQILIDVVVSEKENSLSLDQSLDNTLLSLGLLINIIEKGSKINYITKHHEKVHLELVTIDKLINTFTEWRKCSFSVKNNVATGYLAILLAHLSLKNSNSDNSLSKYIRKKLPNNSYNIIIEFLQEFAQFNMEIEKEAAGTFGIKSSVENYYPTIENTFCKTIKCKGQEYITNIIDTAGQDEYSILNSKHFIGIHGYILVYSVASKSSFEMVKIIRDKILNYIGTEWVPIVVVGNKSDLHIQRFFNYFNNNNSQKKNNRQVTPEDGKSLALQWGCSWTEASARHNENVAKIFELIIQEVEKHTNPNQPGEGINIMDYKLRRFEGCSKPKDYERLEKLGEGTFGEVHKGRKKSTHDLVAMKRILMHNEKEGFPITALREIRILKMLSHVNIIPLMDIIVDRGDRKERKHGSIYMVTPYMDHDLSGLLENPKVNFSEAQIKCYMKQLLEGINYLHQNNIMHRDMKAANLLINNKGILKIADFGLARTFEEPFPNKNNSVLTRREYTNCVVTRWYRPPELLLGEKKYTAAIDMWGAGCVFGEMYKQKPILQGKSDIDQLETIFQICGSPTDFTMPGWQNLPGSESIKTFRTYFRTLENKFSEYGPYMVSLLGHLLTLDPHKRFSALDALNHNYFHTSPLPADPSMLDTYDSSHELDRRKYREEKIYENRLHPEPKGKSINEKESEWMKRTYEGDPSSWIINNQKTKDIKSKLKDREFEREKSLNDCIYNQSSRSSYLNQDKQFNSKYDTQKNSNFYHEESQKKYYEPYPRQMSQEKNINDAVKWNNYKSHSHNWYKK